MNVEKERAALQKETVDGLRAKYLEVFHEPTRSRHKEYLIKRIIWRMQANAYGGLSERALARAGELANEADLRVVAPRNKEQAPVIMQMPAASPADRRLPVLGTVISRVYKGCELQVRILAEGFEYEGERYKTLSAVAKHITGQHMNGFLFFRLKGSRS